MSAREIIIREVGPRDGLQSLPFVETEGKVALIERLTAAGIEEIEITSFVSPKWVPQFADASELANKVANLPPFFSALVPNSKGYESFQQIQPPLAEACFFIGVTDTFNQKNVNRTTQEHLDRFREVVQQIKADGFHALAYLSVVCGCPYEGNILPSEVAALAEQLVEMGFDRLSLGDTIGVGTPEQVKRVVRAVREVAPLETLSFHAHDTYGRAVANVWSAFEEGVHIFDSSIGGIGGCPYAPGAQGNVATEDLVDLFEESGVVTNIDLDKLLDTIHWLQTELLPSESIGGKVYQARQR